MNVPAQLRLKKITYINLLLNCSYVCILLLKQQLLHMIDCVF